MKYEVGDLVLLQTHPLSSAPDNKVAKFQPKYSGPYTISKIVNGNIVITDEYGQKRTVNIDQIKKYYTREKVQPPRPTPRSTKTISARQQSTEIETAPSDYQQSTQTYTTARRETHPISTSVETTLGKEPSTIEESTRRGYDSMKKRPLSKDSWQQTTYQRKKARPFQGQKRKSSNAHHTTNKKFFQFWRGEKRPVSSESTPQHWERKRKQGDKRQRSSSSGTEVRKKAKEYPTQIPNHTATNSCDYPARNTRYRGPQRRNQHDKDLMMQCQEFKQTPVGSTQGEQGSVTSAIT